MTTTPGRTRRLLATSLLAAWAALAGTARADDDHARRAPVAMLPAYVQECGACHVPYAPRLLPAASWQHLMAGLQRHYGSDASLDAATTRAIEGWLATQAGTGRRARELPPEDRITRAAWFVREHREVPPATWSRPAVGSASNCKACHAQADRGAYDEHDVRIPR